VDCIIHHQKKELRPIDGRCLAGANIKHSFLIDVYIKTERKKSSDEKHHKNISKTGKEKQLNAKCITIFYGHSDRISVFTWSLEVYKPSQAIMREEKQVHVSFYGECAVINSISRAKRPREK